MKELFSLNESVQSEQVCSTAWYLPPSSGQTAAVHGIHVCSGGGGGGVICRSPSAQRETTAENHLRARAWRTREGKCVCVCVSVCHKLCKRAQRCAQIQQTFIQTSQALTGTASQGPPGFGRPHTGCLHRHGCLPARCSSRTCVESSECFVVCSFLPWEV